MNKFSWICLAFCLPCSASDATTVTSLVNILSNPAPISGERVSTMGVLALGDFTSLCLDEGSVKYEATFNCVVVQNDEQLQAALGRSAESLDGQYVQVVGTFDATDPKPRNYVGVIRHVEILRKLPL